MARHIPLLAAQGDQISRLRKILRVTTDTDDRAAIKAVIWELEARRAEAILAARFS